MLEHLPWIVAGLAVGLFVGYAFGRYRGASEGSEGLDLEDEIAESGSPRTAPSSSDAKTDTVQKVYIRRGGSHYHREGCSHLRHRGHTVTKEEALKKGFRQCPSCGP